MIRGLSASYFVAHRISTVRQAERFLTVVRGLSQQEDGDVSRITFESCSSERATSYFQKDSRTPQVLEMKPSVKDLPINGIRCG
jgi:hypothetical protein